MPAVRCAHVPRQGQDPAQGALPGGHPQPGAGLLSTPPQDLKVVGERIEAQLERMRASPDAKAHERAETLVRLVSDLYGVGVERMVALAREHSPELLDHMARDEFVAALMMLHGVHPDSLQSRIEGALASVRPMLENHGGDVELLDIDEEVGAVRLRLLGSCDGCPSSIATLQGAVEKAIFDAAPEIGLIDVDEPEQPVPGVSTPVILGTKPTHDACPSELAST